MTVTAVTVATDPTPVVVTKVVPLGAAPTTGTTLDSSGLSQQDADMNAILAKNNKFVMQLVRDNVDLKTLPRGELAASMASPPATLDELKANAVLIVHGVVTRLDITPNEVAAEIMVKDSAKGNARPGNTIRITTRELLTPNPDYTGGMLGLFPSYPGLFKGDEAVFLVTNPKRS